MDPTGCELKVTAAGARFAAAPEPVPVSASVCGLLMALSVTVTVPVCVPAAEGVKVTLMAQVAPAATALPQVFVSANCALAAIEVMVRLPLPLLVSMTVWGALVTPTVPALKMRLAGAKVAAGATPIPVSERA